MANIIEIKLYCVERPFFRKVLFAEAKKDFIDLLFNLLSLPLSTVTKLIQPEKLGSLSNLTWSLDHLDKMFIESDVARKSVLTPTLVNYNTNVDEIFYVKWSRLGSNEKTKLRKNHGILDSTIRGLSQWYCPPKVDEDILEEKKGIVKDDYKYLVTDALKVEGIHSPETYAAVCNRFGVDVASLSQKRAYVRMDEALRILKASLKSDTVLTDVYLRAPV